MHFIHAVAAPPTRDRSSIGTTIERQDDMSFCNGLFNVFKRINSAIYRCQTW